MIIAIGDLVELSLNNYLHYGVVSKMKIDSLGRTQVLAYWCMTRKQAIADAKHAHFGGWWPINQMQVLEKNVLQTKKKKSNPPVVKKCICTHSFLCKGCTCGAPIT